MSIDVIAGAAAGPFAAACLVLAFAGVSKIRHPNGTRPAVAALGLPVSPVGVRALGVAEAGVASAGLAIGGVAAAAVAALYGLLAIAAWRLFVRAPGTPCGCLGPSDAPVTAKHVVVDLGAMIAAAFATAAGQPFAAVGGSAWLRVSFVVLVGCCAWMVASLLDDLPALDAAVREGSIR